MDETQFQALMVKLQSAIWTLSNALSNTKIFSTKINNQRIKLYNVENGPIYINSQRLELTAAQTETMLDFIEQLVENFATNIVDAQNEKEQSLLTALNIILGGD